MAIFFSTSCCAVCEKPLGSEARNCFATTAFLNSSHPLWCFNDAPMHWRCFLAWPHRREFARAYVDCLLDFESTHALWHLVGRQDGVVFQYGEIGEFDIMLEAFATRLRVPVVEYEGWLSADAAEIAAEGDLNELIEAREHARRLLRSEWPTRKSIRAAVEATRERIMKKKAYCLEAHPDLVEVCDRSGTDVRILRLP